MVHSISCLSNLNYELSLLAIVLCVVCGCVLVITNGLDFMAKIAAFKKVNENRGPHAS